MSQVVSRLISYRGGPQFETRSVFVEFLEDWWVVGHFFFQVRLLPFPNVSASRYHVLPSMTDAI